MINAVYPEPSLDPAELRANIDLGHIPSLIPVLYQLTGDLRWLEPPYSLGRTRGFEELDDGGLPETAQAEVRDAAYHAVLAWSRGRPPAVSDPTDSELSTLMTACIADEISSEFAPMAAEHMGLRPFIPDDVSTTLAEESREFSVIVIGAGVSGIAVGYQLRQAGIPFTIIDKNSDVGGTWWENRYPGARADIPTHLYSFSFAPHNWTEHFSQRNEISAYLRESADRLGVRPSIQFETEVESARWDEGTQTWTVSIIDSDGARSELVANAVVTATGLHNRPHVPQFDGINEFKGEVIHSAAWPEGTNVNGKKVAVVGTGASAMQVVVAISEQVESMLVLQRTPHWIAPNDTYFIPTADHARWLFEHVPFYRSWYRFRLYWLYTERLRAGIVVDPEWKSDGKSVSKVNEVYRKFFTHYLMTHLEGREDLQKKSLPDYPPFGKRILLDNGWFETLKRPNVELLAEGVGRLTETGVVATSGEERDVDTLILCTGFEQQRFLYPLEIEGRDGRLLRNEWDDDDARAYLGVTSPGFPNLFYLYGPNTNPASGSYYDTAEAQARYIVEMLTTMVEKDISSVEVRKEPYDKYNDALDEANDQMAYAQPGFTNYYRNSRGRVVTNQPWPKLHYYTLTRQPNLEDFHITEFAKQPEHADGASE